MSLKNSGRMAVLSLLAVIFVFSETSFSQEEPQLSSGCKHCFNAKRFPACCSYWVTDIGIGAFTSSYSDPYSSHMMLFADLGYMVNLNEKTSIGGTLFGASDEDRSRAGVRFRYRRWLNDNTTLDLSPGILVLGDDAGPGLITTANISYNSRISAYAGMEIFRIEYYTYNFFPPYDVSYGKSTETSFFAGAGVGQEAGIVGYGVLAGLIIIVALTWDYQVIY